MIDYKNYYTLEKFSLRYDYYCFVDTEKYLADALFIRHGVRVNFQQEYQKAGTNYLIIFCKVRKKEKEEFLAALEELKNKMILLGHVDYQEFCEKLSKNILEKTHRNC